MPAISLQDSEVRQMHRSDFKSEKQYYISINIAKSMLEKGIITKDVFDVIDTNLKEKYKPISVILISGKPLT